MDSNRYISRMTRKGSRKLVPKLAGEKDSQEDQYARLERLKKRAKNHTEKWSA